MGNVEAVFCSHIDRDAVRNKVLDMFISLPFELNIL